MGTRIKRWFSSQKPDFYKCVYRLLKAVRGCFVLEKTDVSLKNKICYNKITNLINYFLKFFKMNNFKI
jgi:hypothetical protein